MVARLLLAPLLALALAPVPAPAQTAPAAPAAPPAASWNSFTPAEGHFTVQVPAPAERREDITADGPAKGAKNVVYFAPLRPSLFMVAFSDYPDHLNPDPQAEITANRDSFLKGMDATHTGTKVHKLGSREGIEFTGTKAAAGNAPALAIRGRVYMQGRRPVMTAVVTTAENGASPDVLRFLDSFQLK